MSLVVFSIDLQWIGRAVTFITASVVCVWQLSELHVRDLSWVAWPVLCDHYLAPWLLDIVWRFKTLNYEREHIINFYGICQLRGLFSSKEHFNLTCRKKSHTSNRSWNLHYRLIHDMHLANLYVLDRPFRAKHRLECHPSLRPTPKQVARGETDDISD